MLATSAQTQTQSGGIYTCIDAQGRKITADRPIAACADREQKILNPSGTVKAKVGPVLSDLERETLAAKDKEEAQKRARVEEDKRRDRALVVRYPNKMAHDKERAEALAQIAQVKQMASIRKGELLTERGRFQQEMEFYKKDPRKAPARLRRQVEDVDKNIDAQNRFLADQELEIQRVSQRFDEELVRLKQLWSLMAPAPRAASSSGG